MKTAELTGAQLDRWVAKALGLSCDYLVNGQPACRVPDFIDCPHKDDYFGDMFTPSSRWDHGGPIIEREKIMLVWDTGSWAAEIAAGPTRSRHIAFGGTPLEAAMRAFVASKYGDEVPAGG